MPQEFIIESVLAIARGLCTVSSTAQDFGLGAVFKAETNGVEFQVNILRMIQRTFCNKEPEPGYDPPFVGGQCFVNYNVTVELDINRRDGNPAGLPTTYVRVAPGRIEGIQVDEEFREGFVQYITSVQSRLSNGTIFKTELLAIRRDIFLPPTGTFTTIARQDGAPDTCGSPRPSIPPSEPGDRTTDISFTYTDESGDDIDVDATATYGDINFGINGDLEIPVSVTIDSDPYAPVFNYNINLGTGEIKPSFDSPNYPPSKLPKGSDYSAPDVPEIPEDVPQPVAPPSSDPPEDESTGVIRACIVTVSEISPANSLLYQQGGNPDIIVPNAGFVSFYIDIGGKTGWTEDIPVKNKRCFVTCPWVGGAIAVRGTPRPGVEWTITPVYAQSELPGAVKR